jgi:lysine biosynthesis protein LysW
MTSTDKPKIVTTCPSCGQRIGLRGTADLGRRIVCAHCGVELKVTRVEPLVLSKAYRD